MFTIKDGRDCFYQWDRDVRLNIDSDKVSEVHFIRSCMKEPLTVKVDTSGDVPSVEVPNILLQTYGSLTAYAYVKDENGQYTKDTQRFHIEPRPKPTDYVYTETEVKTFSELEERIKYLEKNGGGGMTEEQAKQLTQNTEDIRKLTSEKADKEYVVSVFEELKRLLHNGETDSAIALLDSAILDLSTLA